MSAVVPKAQKEQGDVILAKDTNDFPIGEIAKEFLEFCKESKISEVRPVHSKFVMTHPRRLIRIHNNACMQPEHALPLYIHHTVCRPCLNMGS